MGRRLKARIMCVLWFMAVFFLSALVRSDRYSVCGDSCVGGCAV